MLRINLVEDCAPVVRQPATPKEVFEAALVMIFVAAVFSAFIIIALNGLLSIYTD